MQIAGVSYANLGEAGLAFLSEMVEGGGRARALTTLNPAGMDIENRGNLGISEEFAENQLRVLEAFGYMNIITTATCTPYLIGNTPHFGWHIAWVESSAVCYAKFAADTCCVVVPIKGRFTALATDSAEACYYAYAKNKFMTALLPLATL